MTRPQNCLHTLRRFILSDLIFFPPLLNLNNIKYTMRSLNWACPNNRNADSRLLWNALSLSYANSYIRSGIVEVSSTKCAKRWSIISFIFRSCAIPLDAVVVGLSSRGGSRCTVLIVFIPIWVRGWRCYGVWVLSECMVLSSPKIRHN